MGPLGATFLGNRRTSFVVWAPVASRVEVRLGDGERTEPLRRGSRGYHRAVLDGVEPGARYAFVVDGSDPRPDPASRFQPEGVHGRSEVVDPSAFSWRTDVWFGRSFADYVLYELHVGTFSAEGTFDGVIEHLDELVELGVTAVELMPVAQFPGGRNWGYDGVLPFAVQNSYGGPDGLRRLVDACHQRGLCAVLDVVYNHFGPEGSYLREFGPYFTPQYRTPWGDGINFDAEGSDEVRRYFVENALHWFADYRFDALRLDAIDSIVDPTARPFLLELSEAVHEQAERHNRRQYLIAESASNDPRVIQRVDAGGLGIDAQWNDDFHHAVHTLLTGERDGYYADYGRLAQLQRSLEEGYVYRGEHSTFRGHRFGASAATLPAERFVVFVQNHDQTGNRMLGERLSTLVPFETQKLAAGLLLLSPFVPLLFMGEEYGETAPFQYFISHSEEDLVESVRQGRREEFAAFGWEQEPPDPQSEDTFEAAKLNRDLLQKDEHAALRTFYHKLLRLRRDHPALRKLSKDDLEVVTDPTAGLLFLRRWDGVQEVMAAFNVSEDAVAVPIGFPDGLWVKLLDSADQAWGGPGGTIPDDEPASGELTVTLHPTSFALFARRVPTIR